MDCEIRSCKNKNHGTQCGICNAYFCGDHSVFMLVEIFSRYICATCATKNGFNIRDHERIISKDCFRCGDTTDIAGIVDKCNYCDNFACCMECYENGFEFDMATGKSLCHSCCDRLHPDWNSRRCKYCNAYNALYSDNGEGICDNCWMQFHALDAYNGSFRG